MMGMGVYLSTDMVLLAPVCDMERLLLLLLLFLLDIF